jgi:hypothetical protein
MSRLIVILVLQYCFVYSGLCFWECSLFSALVVLLFLLLYQHYYLYFGAEGVMSYAKRDSAQIELQINRVLSCHPFLFCTKWTPRGQPTDRNEAVSSLCNPPNLVEAIAPVVQQLALEVQKHTTSCKMWWSGTQTCHSGAKLVQMNLVWTSGVISFAKTTLYIHICTRVDLYSCPTCQWWKKEEASYCTTGAIAS